MSDRKALGNTGEQKAVEYLQQKGYIILEKNWRTGRSEIDIIAQDKKIIVFAEVKTRTSFKFGNPEQSVDMQKQKHMAKAAGSYLYKNNLENEVRFDIIAIYFTVESGWDIKHFEDAFFPNPADEIDSYEN